MHQILSLRLIVPVLLALVLAGCESSEERAEKHFQSGMALLEEGDQDRALVEFRNVFKLNGRHREARQTYAAVVLEQGKFREAYGQYLRLVEQYPDDGIGRRALAEMAFQASNWDEFARHGAEAVTLLPEDDRVKIIDLGLKFRQAALDEDNPQLTALTEDAAALIKDAPDSTILRTLLIDGYLRDGRYTEALRELEATIALTPDNRTLYNQKLALLNQLGDMEALEQELAGMVARFPKDNTVKQTLLRFYMARGEVDKAEDFLRQISSPEDEDPALYLSLVQFLSEQRGPDAALEEINTAIQTASNADLLRSIAAGIDFQQGRRDKAIADLEAMLENAEPSDQTNRIRITLARMFISTGNEVGARRLVEQVLADDAGQNDALKMQAAWAIEGDSADEAIVTLRQVLDQSPQDAQAMVLMSQAYTRVGSHELARDFLSLSVEASGNAPEYALRYAQLLVGEGRLLPAEDTLISALRVSPDNVQVLAALGQIYLRSEDTARAEQVVATLRRIGSTEALQASRVLGVNLLNQNEGTAAAITELEQIASEGGGNAGAHIAVVQARLNEGEAEEALRYITQVAADNPDNATLVFVLHATQAAAGELEEAEAGYKALTVEYGDRERIWMALARVQTAQGKLEEAAQTLTDGLAANPTAPNLLWAKATQLEQAGNIDGAIEIYEDLYEAQSNSAVIANNLGSLLSTYRTSDEDLERAYLVARRLRGTNVPAFQDTYGWIMYRRGDFEEALRNLEPAAAALVGDPLVQFHLGMTYKALGRTDEARRQFLATLEIAGEVDTRPQITQAREELRSLDADATGTDDSQN